MTFKTLSGSTLALIINKRYKAFLIIKKIHSLPFPLLDLEPYKVQI